MWLFNSRRQALTLLAYHVAPSRCLTFELRRDRRQSARPGGGMINLTWSRAWWFAVGPRLERGVRPRSAAVARCSRQLVKELPGVCAIEFAYSHRGHKLRIKVPKVDAMLGAWLMFKRFPVRHRPAGSAADRSHGSIALDVLGRVLWVSFDLDCSGWRA